MRKLPVTKSIYESPGDIEAFGRQGSASRHATRLTSTFRRAMSRDREGLILRAF